MYSDRGTIYDPRFRTYHTLSDINEDDRSSSTFSYQPQPGSQSLSSIDGSQHSGYGSMQFAMSPTQGGNEGVGSQGGSGGGRGRGNGQTGFAFQGS